MLFYMYVLTWSIHIHLFNLSWKCAELHDFDLSLESFFFKDALDLYIFLIRAYVYYVKERNRIDE